MKDEQKNQLRSAAKQAAKGAYVPYSHYPVGAAVLMENDIGAQQVFSGCNIENASYGLTNCAERTAVFAAIAQGYCKLLGVAVYVPASAVAMPCGACRQVLNEFGPTAPVVCVNDNTEVVTSVSEILPHAFGPQNL